MKLILATALFGAIAIGGTVAAALPLFQHVELQAVTFAGDVYIAGAGGTCADAFQGAVYPDDWRELKCVKAWGL